QLGMLRVQKGVRGKMQNAVLLELRAGCRFAASLKIQRLEAAPGRKRRDGLCLASGEQQPFQVFAAGKPTGTAQPEARFAAGILSLRWSSLRTLDARIARVEYRIGQHRDQVCPLRSRAGIAAQLGQR